MRAVSVMMMLMWSGVWSSGLERPLMEEVLSQRGLRHLCLITCQSPHLWVRAMRGMTARWSVSPAGGEWWRRCRGAEGGPVAVVVDSTCTPSQGEDVLREAGSRGLLSARWAWLVFPPVPLRVGTDLPLNVATDLTLVIDDTTGGGWELVEVFNFGHEQGGGLQTTHVGHYSHTRGLVWRDGSIRRYKYYDRWDFRNLTLRAVTVVGAGGRVSPGRGEEGGPRGMSAMTRVSARLLHDLAHIHNFRFNYTVVDRWVASPHKNATPGVTNTLYWRQQDISMTCIRIFSNWLDWMDPFYPPTFYLETRFYYLSTGSESGENMFVRPLSVHAWGGVCAAGALSVLALGASAAAQGHPGALLYGAFTVIAALAQQAYEDGVRLFETRISGLSRRWSVLVVGAWSLMVYNYYTSSVVSWLLVAAPPRLSDLAQLARSDLRLLFQDIGYTRSWLQSPRFYYYAGYARPEEDHLRSIKVGTRPVLRDLNEGLHLVRTDKYAYHAEPEEVSSVLGAWSQRDLCQLGTLSMMPPSPVYIVGQKDSPFKEFFNWRLVRMSETGAFRRSARLAPRPPPRCESRPPRPLALAPALPAFALLALAALLAAVLLGVEVITYRWTRSRTPAILH